MNKGIEVVHEMLRSSKFVFMKFELELKEIVLRLSKLVSIFPTELFFVEKESERKSKPLGNNSKIYSRILME